MAKSVSERILATPTGHAKNRYLYVQEIGTLTSMEPHVSSRENLSSYLMLMVVRGEGYLTYRGKKHFIKEGDCVYINCRNPYSHESTLEHPWTLMWVHFNGNGADDFYQSFQDGDRSSIFHPEDIHTFRENLTHLYEVMRSKQPLMELCAHRYLTDLITFCFTENRPERKGGSPLGGKLHQIRSYLDEHYMERITLEELSARFFISKYHLSREYRRNFGVTIGSDLNARRISHAKSLLRFTGKSIEETASECGFQDTGYFIKVFKKAENMTPFEYRKKW